MRWVIALVACACGRVGFDPRADASFAIGDGDGGILPMHGEAYVKMPTVLAGDQAGLAIALSADASTLAVGAPFASSAAGAVWVFTRSGATWTKQAALTASNADANDRFGWALALSSTGDTLAVSANQEASAATGIGGNQADNTAASAGAVYVFVRNAGAWTQDAYIKASNTDAGDEFGRSVALSADGKTLAVGAFLESSSATGIDGNQTLNNSMKSGAVYVFAHDIGWTQQAYIKASNTDQVDEFGYDVTLSADGNTLAVGAVLEDSSATGIAGNQADNAANDSGAAYVFVRAGVTWSQQAYIKASNTDAGDYFGQALALSGDGNTLAVGAWLEDSAATGIDGNQADNTDMDSGAVYVFTRGGDIWSQQAYVKASNPDAMDHFGFALALTFDGSALAVGAYQEDSNATLANGNQADNSAVDSGAVYAFVRGVTGWSQLAYLKASNTGAGDLFGAAIAVSGDGSIIAVGAPLEDGDGASPASDTVMDSGAVYVFY